MHRQSLQDLHGWLSRQTSMRRLLGECTRFRQLCDSWASPADSALCVGYNEVACIDCHQKCNQCRETFRDANGCFRSECNDCDTYLCGRCATGYANANFDIPVCADSKNSGYWMTVWPVAAVFVTITMITESIAAHRHPPTVAPISSSDWSSLRHNARKC